VPSRCGDELGVRRHSGLDENVGRSVLDHVVDHGVVKFWSSSRDERWRTVATATRREAAWLAHVATIDDW
jgi:hypothetical protein